LDLAQGVASALRDNAKYVFLFNFIYESSSFEEIRCKYILSSFFIRRCVVFLTKKYRNIFLRSQVNTYPSRVRPPRVVTNLRGLLPPFSRDDALGQDDLNRMREEEVRDEKTSLPVHET